MLHLYINNVEAELSADTTFDFTKENPFFEKKGDYTYDIELSLRSKVNCQIFTNIRKFSNEDLNYDFTGELKEGNTTLCKGKIIILEKEDKTIKIQIVSDNSELNYVISDVNIRDLELGSAAVNMTDILENIDNIYPNVNYNFPMVEGYYNDYNAADELNIYGTIAPGNFSYNTVRQYMSAQPFVCFIIKLVLEALGYTLTSSFIENQTKWKRLVMINPYKTNEYARMLPDWTGTEFVEEIEKFFNGIFLVDGTNVQFENVGSWYEEVGEETFTDNMIDKFDIEFVEEDDREVLGSSNDYVDYKGTDNQFWKAAKLDDEFIAKCTLVESDPDLNDYKSFNVYVDTKTALRSKPFAEEDDDGNASGNRLVQVNQYKPYIKDDTKEKEELKIFPAEIRPVLNGIMVPVVKMEGLASVQNFWEEVDDGISEDDKRDYMNVAFYIGKQYALSGYNTYDTTRIAPCCITSYYQFRRDTPNPFGIYPSSTILDYDEYMTLELAGTKGRGQNEMQNNINWDDAHKYTIRLLTKEILDPKKIFIIRGRRFICRQIKYEFENCKMKSYCEGEFYPLL